MRMTVFGAAGQVGRRTVSEALSRGHDVTAVVRDPARYAAALPPGARRRSGDASDPAAVARLARGQDVVISATRPGAGREQELVATAEALLDGTARSGVRLLLVGGAGTLTVPGPGGGTVADAPDFPDDWKAVAAACAAQLDACRAAPPAADWTYLSPPALLEPGKRTGVYRRGADTLLTDPDGRSVISLEDFAVALIDEAEHPRHRRGRFTVAY
ncbi:NAD(P)-dependent oxidoreductase [Streptomyces sp. t39]|uniref:NAD(P)-dependent oxidoreductase n=1 Tax=Streptomyces sp. t39 TaxID=1828156 RepID=UPI0011CEA2B8|nr:NAD(P)H-binding protein [Streptomyces sp. t39]TXS49844.1 NAD-dependent epimerase/dehydratase family protein [Streptomyces sp. t39]